jgi:maltoporin
MMRITAYVVLAVVVHSGIVGAQAPDHRDPDADPQSDQGSNQQGNPSADQQADQRSGQQGSQQADQQAGQQGDQQSGQQGGKGTYFRLSARLAFDAGSLADYQNVQLFAPELYVEAGKFNVCGPFADARYWAGKRFYRQDEVHINDFYFWDMSGPGAGVEKVDIGIGKLAFAYSRTGDG